jgi:hypothetical protein
MQVTRCVYSQKHMQSLWAYSSRYFQRVHWAPVVLGSRSHVVPHFRSSRGSGSPHAAGPTGAGPVQRVVGYGHAQQTRTGRVVGLVSVANGTGSGAVAVLHGRVQWHVPLSLYMFCTLRIRDIRAHRTAKEVSMTKCWASWGRKRSRVERLVLMS